MVGSVVLGFLPVSLNLRVPLPSLVEVRLSRGFRARHEYRQQPVEILSSAGSAYRLASA
jgi:hypothetical protein